MKIKLTRNSLLICMLFLFSSCSTANKTGDLVFKNFSKQGKTHLLNDKDAPKATFEFNVEYPTKGDAQLVEWVQSQISIFNFGKSFTSLKDQEAVDEFADNYNKGYIDEVEPLYKEELEQTKNKEDVGHWYNYEITLQSTPVLYKNDLLVIESFSYEYTGGAHGVSAIHYLNLDLANKSIITFEELFLPNAKDQLTELIKEQLKKDLKTDSLDKEGYWSKSITPTNNIRITDTGISFVYNVYEIAPYVMGPTEVTVPFAKLKDLFNKNNLIVSKLL